jgi:hypothetical protein
MADSRIEAVARGFYNTQDCARGWDKEPEWLKEQFLILASSAVDTLDRLTLDISREIQPTLPSDQDQQ